MQNYHQILQSESEIKLLKTSIEILQQDQLHSSVVPAAFVVLVLVIPLYAVEGMSELLKPSGTESKQTNKKRIEHNKTSAHFFCLIFCEHSKSVLLEGLL